MRYARRAHALLCDGIAGGALLLAGLAFCVAVARKRRHRGHGAGDKTPGAAPDLMGVLFGTSGAAGTPSGVLSLKLQPWQEVVASILVGWQTMA